MSDDDILELSRTVKALQSWIDKTVTGDSTPIVELRLSHDSTPPSAVILIGNVEVWDVVDTADEEPPIFEQCADEWKRHCFNMHSDFVDKVPGMTACETCGFSVQATILHVNSGTTSPGDPDDAEPCPNGCGTELQPVTWYAMAQDANKKLVQYFDRCEVYERALRAVLDNTDNLIQDKHIATQALTETGRL